MKLSTAFLKAHSNLQFVQEYSSKYSNLQFVREYSSWKVRLPVSSENLQPLLSGERPCMLIGHFPVPY